MALDVMVVGATYNTVTPCIQWQGTLTSGGKAQPLSFTPGSRVGFPSTGLAVWAPTKSNKTADGSCNQVASDMAPPADPANTILLVERSSCWVDQDGVSLTASPRYNFTYVMRHMFATPDSSPKPCPWFTDADADADTTKGIISISNAAGLSMIAELTKGGNVTVALPSNAVDGKVSLTSINNTEGGGQLTYYSSWGPSLDGRGRPTLVAPGHNILSTFPSYLGDWGVIGGTSMSTPLVAGVAAPVKQTHPGRDGAQVQAAMALTARPIRFNTRQRSDYYGQNRDFLAPVIAQGAGFVDAWAAVHTATVTNTTSLNFNDTTHRPSHLGDLASLPMINRDQTYSAGHDAAAPSSGDRLPAGRVFECRYRAGDRPPCAFPADGLAPGLVLSLVTPTRHLTINLVDRATRKSVMPPPGAGGGGGVYTSGSGSPWDGSGYRAWDGGDRDRALVPAGAYAWRVTARRLNADSGAVERDWDVWESEGWVLRYAADSTGLPAGKV